MTYAGKIWGVTKSPGFSYMIVLAHNPKRQETEGGASGFEAKLCSIACPRPAGAITARCCLKTKLKIRGVGEPRNP